jgi:hypothetical protein
VAFHDWYWLIWLVVIFLIYELYAARFTPDKKDTFSEWSWDVFAVRRRGAPYGPLRRFILQGMTISLYFHLNYATSAWPVGIFGVGVAWTLLYHFGIEMRRRGRA